MGRLHNKVAMITGAALGIGRAIAVRFAEAGAAVALTDVLDTPGKEVAASITAKGGTARYYHLDVSKEAQVESVCRQIEHDFGRLNVLINNAGILGVSKPTEEVSEAEWDRVQAVNVKGVFFCTKHAIAALRRAGGGSIINLSSIYGLVGAPDVPPYHASKGAVRLMTKTDALLYAKDKIRVNSIHPGAILTPMLETLFAQTGDAQQAKQQMALLHPLGEIGDPDDIAYAALYLASNESKFVTGAEFVIDGGYTCR